jgi:hypothetical protein
VVASRGDNEHALLDCGGRMGPLWAWAILGKFLPPLSKNPVKLLLLFDLQHRGGFSKNTGLHFWGDMLQMWPMLSMT